MTTGLLGAGTLAYFIKVAELGGFTVAARELGISQPSLSVAIRKLEQELETQLFVRDSRGVQLTSTGEVLLRYARDVARALDSARDEIRGLESEPCGRYELGVHESLAAYFLPSFMARFLRRFPGIEIQLWNGNSRDVEQGVVDRRLDLGLVVNPDGHPDCVVQPLFTDRVELVVASAVRRRHRGALGQLIEDHPLLYVPALRQTQYLLGALAQQGLAPAQHLPCSSLELVKNLTLDGVGIGILPLRVAGYGVARGRLVPVSSSLPHYDDGIALVRRYDMHRTAAARLVLDELRAHGKAMTPLKARRGRRR